MTATGRSYCAGMTSPVTTPRPAGTGLDISGLGQTFEMGRRSVTALPDVSLHTSEGSFLSLLGPSGCGKSTVLRILAGLDSPPSGTALVHGPSPADYRQPPRT